MKKYIKTIALMLILASCVALFVFAEPQLDHITDAYGIITDSEFTQLEKLAEEVETKYSIGIYYIAVDNFTKYADDTNVKDAAHSIYDEYELGIGNNHEGLLLFMSMAERDYAIIPVGPLSNRVFNDSGLTSVEDKFLDNFKVNDWAGGIKDYINGAASVLSNRLESAIKVQNNVDSGNVLYSGGRAPAINLAIIVGVPLLIAGITVIIFAVGMSNANVKTTAGDYIKRDSVQFTAREDRFIRRSETRTKIEKSSSSGGSSSGSSGHSGKF